jgi:two-component system sensor histidine kinase HydH
MNKRWDLLGGAIGLGVACFDLWMFGMFGLELGWLFARPVGWAVLGGFTAGYAAAGFVIGRLVIARSRIRAQMRALEENRARLVQSEKLAALGRLAAGIAHEVRNPLGVIRASASMVEEGLPIGGDDQRACAFIKEEIDRLDGLIGALLAFARPAKMSLGTVLLPRLFERAAELARKDGSIEVDPRVEGSVPELRADGDLLTQLLFGLFVNAAEAGAKHVSVRARKERAGVAIDVADDGPGIDTENVERVLEPFFTTKASGTGLGLAMAARIVEAHGGTIEVRGKHERGGACFVIHLPAEGPAVLAAA